MTSPIERAARALAEDAYDRQHCGLPTEPTREQFVSVMEASYRSTARAVLTAIREPSEGMWQAGDDHCEHRDTADPKAVWQAMIDAALSEGG